MWETKFLEEHSSFSSFLFRLPSLRSINEESFVAILNRKKTLAVLASYRQQLAKCVLCTRVRMRVCACVGATTRSDRSSFWTVSLSCFPSTDTPWHSVRSHITTIHDLWEQWKCGTRLFRGTDLWCWPFSNLTQKQYKQCWSSFTAIRWFLEITKYHLSYPTHQN